MASCLSKTIKIKLDVRSINAAIKEIEAYRNKLSRINEEICKKLADKGLEKAQGCVCGSSLRFPITKGFVTLQHAMYLQ